MKYSVPTDDDTIPSPRLLEITRVQAIAKVTLKEFAASKKTGDPIPTEDTLQSVRLWMTATRREVKCFAILAFDKHSRQWVDPLTWLER